VKVYCEAGQLELVSSTILAFETGRTPDPVRREYGWMVLTKASHFIDLKVGIEQRARILLAHGIAPLDALHLASAEAAEAGYFCTCDDKLLAKAKKLADLLIRVLSPIELIEEVEK
jgi:predicted nucleic acid-binding protein